jgi:ribonucleoside-diphosphate reductase alpha subunit
MRIVNREGTDEICRLDAVTDRITKACGYSGLDTSIVDPILIATKVCSNMRDGITSAELDEITVKICMNLSLKHTDFGTLGSRIAISNHQKNIKLSFCETMVELYNSKDKKGNHSPKISEELHELVKSKGSEIEAIINEDLDFNINFFGFKTLERAYFSKIDNTPVETPQYMWLRVALGIWGNDMEKVKNTYNLLSNKYFTHATPTLFNSGTKTNNSISCFLLGTEDSVDGIFSTIKNCANISKVAGGIGIHITNVRARGSYVRGTSGDSDGLMPMLRVYNDTARYINQGSRRNGSFAVYISPWHADVKEFLYAKRNHGVDDQRARDLFYALFISDLFMTRVKNNETWSLMCPDECPGLTDSYGQEFEELYKTYENNKLYKEQLPAREIWDIILTTQIETGMPYMLYKDAINRKSNQKNIGVIKSSNLCSEITLVSDEKEFACCNLVSLRLSSYITPNKEIKNIKNNEVKMYGKEYCSYCKMAKALFIEHNIEYTYVPLDDDNLRQLFYKEYNVKSVPQIFVGGERIGGFNELLEKVRPEFDYDKLEEVVHVTVENLNRIIDINFYPTPECKLSNFKHRPIGIGVQGLADVFMEMWLPYESEQAKKLNKKIFETIYYAAATKSMLIAKERKEQDSELLFNEYETPHEDYPGAYSTFFGSPLQQGEFQFDMWGVTPTPHRYDWESLRKNIKLYGVRNSTFTALMPTASTAQILGSSPSFEPVSSNMYLRRTLAGEFKVINEYLMKILNGMGIWDDKMKDRVMFHRGSIQKIGSIPLEIREIFKTAYELKQKTLIDMSADRGAYICQSQSFNIFVNEATPELLTKIHMYGWNNGSSRGLKTGSYYIRSKPAVNSQQFTINPNLEQEFRDEMNKMEDQECLNCGS